MKDQVQGGVRSVAAGCLPIDASCDDDSDPCQEADGLTECSDCCDENLCNADAIRNGLENSEGTTTTASLLLLCAITMFRHLF